MLDYTKFPSRLVDARKKAEKTQKQVCAATGLDQGQLSRIEAGKESATKGVSIKTLVALANELKCSADSLLR